MPCTQRGHKQYISFPPTDHPPPPPVLSFVARTVSDARPKKKSITPRWTSSSVQTSSSRLRWSRCSQPPRSRTLLERVSLRATFVSRVCWNRPKTSGQHKPVFYCPTVGRTLAGECILSSCEGPSFREALLLLPNNGNVSISKQFLEGSEQLFLQGSITRGRAVKGVGCERPTKYLNANGQVFETPRSEFGGKQTGLYRTILPSPSSSALLSIPHAHAPCGVYMCELKACEEIDVRPSESHMQNDVVHSTSFDRAFSLEAVAAIP